jgi:5'-methylthioadenosine phosphorylase
VEMVVQNLQKNVANSKEMIRRVIPRLNGKQDCPCPTALKDAIITRPQGVPEEIKRRLAPIVGRYMN